MTIANQTKLVTVFGGSGFVGRHIVRALAKRGYRIRVAVRISQASCSRRAMSARSPLSRPTCASATRLTAQFKAPTT
jgi:nucleoside-diphosphate-sugar epimerase